MTAALPIMTLILAAIAAIAAVLAWLEVRKRNNSSNEVVAGFASVESVVDKIAASIREDIRSSREELARVLGEHNTAQETRSTNLGTALDSKFGLLGETLKQATDAFGETQTKRLGETNEAMRLLGERLEKQQNDGQTVQKDSLEGVAKKIQELLESNEKRQEAIRETLNLNLETLRKEMEAKLEQMRLTVDEKLQGTLDKRLGESFQIVSDRLEKVHQGLGEMQSLATGVGDLKRVLTSVRSRGAWAEVQLGTLIEDMLAPDQYLKNAHVRPDSQEVVEYAIKLPDCLMAIDAKFPNEAYDRLQTAQEGGDPAEIEVCAIALERAIRVEAQRICQKYIHPPHTTNFAIMYLPTEGLFAEVIRRPGLVADLQQKFRVTVTGPTTLSATLSSFQMGFTTLAIQKRSSEVWQVLGLVKSEFQKYGQVWERLGKQLDTAKNTVNDAGVRTRALERSLRAVEIDAVEATPELVALPTGALILEEITEAETEEE